MKQSSSELHHHAGFELYDPSSKKTLISINGDKYFTPASNTKIFTLYAGLKILGDSVPALRWTTRNDSTIFWGTGDPSFLYRDVFQNQKTFNFLKNAPSQLVFADGNFSDDAFGPGWSWADYQYYYQVERSSFPVYGNLISVSKELGINPSYFKSLSKETTKGTEALHREQFSNQLTINRAKLSNGSVGVIPFTANSELTVRLLSDTLNRAVGYLSRFVSSGARVLHAMPVDSIYQTMMQVSDNFIAEQILMMCAQKISDTLRSDIAIQTMLKNYLADLPDKPVWVDGSGLSRYNQMTPRSIVKLWEKIYTIVPKERLFPLLVSNGKNGTLRNFLKDKPPIIFGKTGSLNNNFCLSGFLITKKGRLLIFSSMNANFIGTTKPVRDNLERILMRVYEKY